MHGLINIALENFIKTTYGGGIWAQIATRAGLREPGFEAMMRYDAEVTEQVVEAAKDILQTERADFLQDLGTFLVSPQSGQAVRRLLRFGGVNFVEFLYSLDDLNDRARLAVVDLELPHLELREHTPSQFSLLVRSPADGFGHVMVGLLTAMADDYGALVMLEHGGRVGQIETIGIALLEPAFTKGNHFDLAGVQHDPS